jgi:RND family efflux transporter MFP subunit
MRIQSIIISAAISLAFYSCKHNYSNNEEIHNRDENFQLSSYNDEFEVFAEVAPLAVGSQSSILAHFSYLKDFKPLAEGSVTVSLIVGTDGICRTLDKPTGTGIYGFSLQPVVAGKGRLVFDITTPQGVSQLVIADIQVFDDLHDAQRAAAGTVKTSSNGVVFTKEQSWKVDFSTDTVREEPFGQVIKTAAQVQPSQGDERIITALTSGITTLSANNIVEGEAVRAGQTLFGIESAGMADNNLSVRYQEAESQYMLAKSEYERKEALAKDRIVSASELARVKAEYVNTEANFNNLRKNFSAGKQSVSSPISGFVKQVLVRNGEYAEAGQPVLVISQNKDLFIKAELQPKYFRLLNDISDANFRELNSDKAYSLSELDGRIVSYGKATEVDNPLIPVTFRVKNSVGLLPGSFVEIYIKTRSSDRALTIPNEAIVEEMGNYFVFVQLTPEYFEKRVIKRGATDGFRTEIKEGVSLGERVVGKGAILVKLSQVAGSLDTHTGHVH